MVSLKGKKVLIGPSSFAALDKAPMKRLLDTGCEVIDNPFKRKLTKPELIGLLSNGITGLIAGLETLDREVLEGSSLKVISRCGVGMSNVDLEAAKKLGIKVFSTPGAPTASVAELTVGALLSMMRMIPQMDRDLHDGKWVKRVGVQLKGKVAAIIGFGRIGKLVAKILKSFEAEVLAVDPLLHSVTDSIPLVSLEEALPRADIITIHCSGDNCILGSKEFKIMKGGVYLLNSARGNVIDEYALIEALKQKKVAGAWLDTFKQEPYEGPLKGFSQVILTPHAGSYTAECRREMEIEAVENLIHAFGQEG